MHYMAVNAGSMPGYKAPRTATLPVASDLSTHRFGAAQRHIAPNWIGANAAMRSHPAYATAYEVLNGPIRGI